MAQVTRQFTSDASITIDGGVKKIRLIVEKKYSQMSGTPKINGQSSGGFVRNLWLDQGGRAWATGSNLLGKLGVNDTVDRSLPTAVVGNLRFITLTGDDNSATGTYCGLTPEGQAWCWGLNLNGQCGDGTVVNKSSPVSVLPNLSFTQVVTNGGSSFYGLTPAGQVYGWGFSPSISGDTIPHSSAVAAVGVDGIIFKKIFGSFGVGNIYFLSNNNKLYGAGVNSLFGLGVGDGIGRSSPVAVGASINFADVAVGGLYSVALDTAGAAWSWGQGASGQLGNGAVANQSTPAAVLGGFVYKQIAATANSSVYGLKTDGTVVAWGANSDGQLAVGDVVKRSSPVAVLGLSGIKIKQIITGITNFGQNNVFFLAEDGTMYGAGAQPDGELGNGDVLSRSSAVAVLGGFKFISMWNPPCCFGLCDDGVVRGWGRNATGQLGLGDVVSRSSPVAVLAASALPPFVYRDEKVISVTPGQTYALKMNLGMVTFGTEIVSLKTYVDSVTLIYEQ